MLADAQLVIAREHSFPSWPRLKRHIEQQVAALAAAGEAGSPAAPPPAPSTQEAAEPLWLENLSIWQRKIRGASRFTAPFGPRPNPQVVDSAVLVALSSPHALCALDRESGRMRWRRPLTALPHGGLLHANGVVYGLTGDLLFALRPESGRSVWQRPIGRAGKDIWYGDASPAVGAGKVFLGDRAGILWCLDAETGQIVWSQLPAPTEKTPINATALVHGQTCIVATLTGFAIGYDVETGSEVWRQALDGPSAAALALFRGHVLVQTTASVCLLRPDDGRIVRRWHWAGRRIRQCVVAGDLLVVVARSLPPTTPEAAGERVLGELELIGVPAGGDGSNATDAEPAYTRPCAKYFAALRWSSETRLLYESRIDGLGILDPRAGERLCDLAPGNAGPVRQCHLPDVRGGVIYVAAGQGRVYALRHPGPGQMRDLPRSTGRRAAASRKAKHQDAGGVTPIASAERWAAKLDEPLSPAVRRIFDASRGGLRALDFAEDEARRLNHKRIGTEHLLLGILVFGYRNALILHRLDVSLEQVTAPIQAEAGGVSLLGQVGIRPGALRAAIEMRLADRRP
ncbi:MAG: PQQ-binding-like beta-propeller repeat protein [Chloroflexi bacterium]|nr:PQQ-binding-like beta-propeller repeat protein [Chloroflexota bacterium]